MGVSRLLAAGPSDVIYDMKSALPPSTAAAASSARPLSRAPPPPLGSLTDNTPIPPMRQSKTAGDANDVVYSTSA